MGLVVNTTSRPLYSREEAVPVVCEWVSLGSVRTGAESFAHNVIWSTDHRESLYRLRHPDQLGYNTLQFVAVYWGLGNGVSALKMEETVCYNQPPVHTCSLPRISQFKSLTAILLHQCHLPRPQKWSRRSEFGETMNIGILLSTWHTSNKQTNKLTK